MIQYRKATTNDIPVLVKLRIDFLNEVMKTNHSDNAIGDSLKQYFSRHLEAGDYINWLAADNDEIISTGGICFYSLPPNFLNATGNRAYILNVYTLPAHRRKGISKHLLEKLMQEANDRNIAQVSLHTTRDGRALYEQFGFKGKENEMVWGPHV